MLVIAVWLLLCFSVFLGFFTVPLLMLMAFSFIFVIFDLQRVLRRRAAENRRKAEDNDVGNHGG